eukprot:TRINITY_DN34765_c0_g1_i2.p1 TRINITY_DN34765_c0_g1~~TRINITY_DN34765_c0_g1_i2.p1  ORF type:complete len:130 (+),score=0.18 TRINITY_DN34765_c0_g1_i2:209-598(+)
MDDDHVRLRQLLVKVLWQLSSAGLKRCQKRLALAKKAKTQTNRPKRRPTMKKEPQTELTERSDCQQQRYHCSLFRFCAGHLRTHEASMKRNRSVFASRKPYNGGCISKAWHCRCRHTFPCGLCLLAYRF